MHLLGSLPRNVVTSKVSAQMCSAKSHRTHRKHSAEVKPC